MDNFEDAVAEINAYRLRRDLTFEQLAAEFHAAGLPMPLKTLHPLLTGKITRPYERTRHKLEQFAAAIRGNALQQAAS